MTHLCKKDIPKAMVLKSNTEDELNKGVEVSLISHNSKTCKIGIPNTEKYFIIREETFFESFMSNK